LVDALSPQEWFQISSQFLNPQNNFGQAALQAGQGIQEGRRNAQMQEREEQLWQRQEQQFQRADDMRQGVAEYYRAQGEEELAEQVLYAPDAAVVDLFAQMTPNARAEAQRAQEAHAMQMAVGRSQIGQARAEAQSASIPGYGDPVRYTVPVGGGQAVISYYEPDTPGRGAPVGVLPDGRAISGEALNELMGAARREADRTSQSSEWAPDEVLVRRYSEAQAATDAFAANLERIEQIMAEAGDDAAALGGPMGLFARIGDAARSQVSTIPGFSILDDGMVSVSADAIDEDNVEAGRTPQEEAEAVNRLADAFRNQSLANQSAAYQSNMLSAAYSLALAFNGGRITEKDFQTALDAIRSRSSGQTLVMLREQRDRAMDRLAARWDATFAPPQRPQAPDRSRPVAQVAPAASEYQSGSQTGAQSQGGPADYVYDAATGRLVARGG
jgi:hypothetical protein